VVAFSQNFLAHHISNILTLVTHLKLSISSEFSCKFWVSRTEKVTT